MSEDLERVARAMVRAGIEPPPDDEEFCDHCGESLAVYLFEPTDEQLCESCAGATEEFWA